MSAPVTQHVGTGGTGASLVTTSRRRYGRGTEVVLVTGERLEDVEAAAMAAWEASDDWLRSALRPVARPMPGGGYEAAFSVSDAE